MFRRRLDKRCLVGVSVVCTLYMIVSQLDGDCPSQVDDDHDDDNHYHHHHKHKHHHHHAEANPQDAFLALQQEIHSVMDEPGHGQQQPFRNGDNSHKDPRGEYVLRDLTKLPAVKSIGGSQTKWDDPALIQLIRTELLETPRHHMTKLSLPLFQTPQAETVDEILNGKTGGFFVECGALDGERSSNTMWLEMQKGWTGLLVEMDPSYYLQLRGKNRNVYSSNVCLSPEKYPMIVNFKEHNHGGGKLSNDNSSSDITLPTFCVPFYSMMLAMHRTKIDYFSLDVEGFEMPILRSIPFDKLDISVLSVEYVHGEKETEDSEDDYVNFMASQGYKVHSKINVTIEEIRLYANDYVFIKESL